MLDVLTGLCLGENTMIRIRKSTRKRLVDTGKKNETYDQIINRLLDGSETRKRKT